MNNEIGYLKCNDSYCPIFRKPQRNNNINLITQCKNVLLPGEFAEVSTSMKGQGLDPFRPFSSIFLLTEGNPILQERIKIEVVPTLNDINKQQGIPVLVKNV